MSQLKSHLVDLHNELLIKGISETELVDIFFSYLLENTKVLSSIESITYINEIAQQYCTQGLREAGIEIEEIDEDNENTDTPTQSSLTQLKTKYTMDDINDIAKHQIISPKYLPLELQPNIISSTPGGEVNDVEKGPLEHGQSESTQYKPNFDDDPITQPATKQRGLIAQSIISPNPQISNLPDPSSTFAVTFPHLPISFTPAYEWSQTLTEINLSIPIFDILVTLFLHTISQSPPSQLFADPSQDQSELYDTSSIISFLLSVFKSISFPLYTKTSFFLSLHKDLQQILVWFFSALSTASVNIVNDVNNDQNGTILLPQIDKRSIDTILLRHITIDILHTDDFKVLLPSQSTILQLKPIQSNQSPYHLIITLNNSPNSNDTLKNNHLLFFQQFSDPIDVNSFIFSSSSPQSKSLSLSFPQSSPNATFNTSLGVINIDIIKQSQIPQSTSSSTSSNSSPSYSCPTWWDRCFISQNIPIDLTSIDVEISNMDSLDPATKQLVYQTMMNSQYKAQHDETNPNTTTSPLHSYSQQSHLLNTTPKTPYLASLQQKQQQLERIAQNNPGVDFSQINVIDGVANTHVIDALGISSLEMNDDNE